jgi:hypothetical protein
MADVGFKWEFRSGERSATGIRFDPGSPVEGKVTITPRADLNCNGINLKLEWHTEGRGDRDSGTAGETNLFQGVLPGGRAAEFPFRMNLPDQPWSYDGHYINIVWELAVDIDLPMAINPKSRSPIVVRPWGA